MKEIEMTINAEVGLHARPASVFVKKAMEFASNITIEKDGRKVDAKRLLAVMSLGVKKGERILIRAEGEDEAEAIAALQDVIESDFN